MEERQTFLNFIDYVEYRILLNGAYQLHDAVTEFYHATNKPTMEKAIGALHSSGKFIVKSGHITGNLIIEKDPSYETSQSVIQTNASARTANAAAMKNYNAQFLMSLATISIAILAMVISYLNYNATRNSTSQKEQILQLTTQLQEATESQLQLLENVNSLRDSILLHGKVLNFLQTSHK